VTSPTKTTKLITKKFFSFQIRRLAESFKGLNSSLAQLAEELCSCLRQLKIAWFQADFQVRYIRTLAANVLRMLDATILDQYSLCGALPFPTLVSDRTKVNEQLWDTLVGNAGWDSPKMISLCTTHVQISF